MFSKEQLTPIPRPEKTVDVNLGCGGGCSVPRVGQAWLDPLLSCNGKQGHQPPGRAQAETARPGGGVPQLTVHTHAHMLVHTQVHAHTLW